MSEENEVVNESTESTEFLIGIRLREGQSAEDYKLVDEYLKMEKPYDIKTAYTNEFLDKNVKMPPINPPKLY